MMAPLGNASACASDFIGATAIAAAATLTTFSASRRVNIAMGSSLSRKLMQFECGQAVPGPCTVALVIPRLQLVARGGPLRVHEAGHFFSDLALERATAGNGLVGSRQVGEMGAQLF